MRVGIGYDVHRFTAGRPLVLGGVHVPHPLGLEGHSDADVLLHAIKDALLGAAALGDIGSHFPDTDDQWKDANSLQLLALVARRIDEAGYGVTNIDATVCIQQPRLRPYIDRMRENIADCLMIKVEQVSVKATTTEGLGFIGSEEGAAAYAICALEAKR